MADSKVVVRCSGCSGAFRASGDKPLGKCPKCGGVLRKTPAEGSRVGVADRPDAGKPRSSSQAGKNPSSRRISSAGGIGKSSRGKPRAGTSSSSRSAGRDGGSSASRRLARPPAAKKSFPIVPVVVAGGIVILAVIGLVVFGGDRRNGPPQQPAGQNLPPPRVAGPPPPSNQASPVEDDWDLDWSQDDGKETEWAKRRKNGFEGKMPPEAYGKEGAEDENAPESSDDSSGSD